MTLWVCANFWYITHPNARAVSSGPGRYKKMVRRMFYRGFPLILCVVLLSSLWVGCKKERRVNPEDLAARVEGRVTDDAGYGKRTGGIGGAHVEVAEVHRDGTLRVLAGTAKSDANGYFALQTEATLLPVILRAETASQAVMLAVDGGLLADSTLQVGPMTVESSLEADLYYQMVQQQLDGVQNVTVADVALMVNPTAALYARETQTSSADLAQSVFAGIRVRQLFLAQNVPLSQSAVARIREAYQRLYRTYLRHMHASVEDQIALAMWPCWLEEQAIKAYETEGVGMLDVVIAEHAQVEALRLIARNLHISNEAVVGLVQQGKWLFAQAAALFVEQRFRERTGASEPPASLLKAKEQLKSSLQAASNLAAISNALQAYRVSLLAQVQVTGGLTQTELEELVNILTSESVAVLNGQLQSATSVDDVVAAYLSFARQVRLTALHLLTGRLEAQFLADMLVIVVLL